MSLIEKRHLSVDAFLFIKIHTHTHFFLFTNNVSVKILYELVKMRGKEGAEMREKVKNIQKEKYKKRREKREMM